MPRGYTGNWKGINNGMPGGSTDFSSLFSSASPYLAAGGSLASILFAPGKRKGQAFEGVLSGASTGAALGSIVPGVGTAIGAGVGALAGGLYGALTESPEEKREKQRKENYEKALKLVGEQKNKAIGEGTKKIGMLTGGLKERFGKGAQSRAVAMGRANDVEAFEAPIAGKVAQAGSQSLKDFLLQTNKYYDDQLSQIELAYQQGGEIDPNAIDYLSSIAPTAVNFAQNQEVLDLFKKYNLN